MSIRRALAPVLLSAIVVACVLTLATITAIASPARSPVCVSSGPAPGLTPAQAANARTLVAIASQRGGQPAAVITVMVALAESNLRVLSNPNSPGSDAYPSQGQGVDHDSLGLFQQRAGWGSAAQRMDPVASTNLFLDSLLAVPGWQYSPNWVVAQWVQRSAFDGHPTHSNGGSAVLGGNYLRHAAAAAAVVDAVESTSPRQDCGGQVTGMLAASPGTHGLPSDYSIPPDANPSAKAAVSYALAQLGKAYVWGTAGPDTYDCSGLTQTAWFRAGVTISRTTWDQVRDGTPTDLTHLAPGDLVLTPGSDGSLAAPGHVGLSLGRGLVVEAPRTGDVVKVVTLASFVSGGTSALRHIA